jgi:anti-anti-sigma factor
LKSALEQALNAGRSRLIVNLLQTTYLDSTALAILSSTARELKQAGGNLALIYNQPQVARLFAITGLNDVVAAYPSEAAALDALRAWVSTPPKT